LGFNVIATDFSSQPLELLRQAAELQGLSKRVATRLLDLRDETPLPAADLVIASDVLYDRGTATAMARRVAEARARGSHVLITDIGRPNRKVFIQELQQLWPDEPIEFNVAGLAVQGPLSAHGRDPSNNVEVDVLALPPSGTRLQAKLLSWPPCFMPRPLGHRKIL
ncbi:unnamed protein product, partial [Polarella glacialis]